MLVSRVCSAATFIEDEVANKREIAAKLDDGRNAVFYVLSTDPAYAGSVEST